MAVDDGQMGIHAREKNIVLGFDPGRNKTGFAFVNKEGGLIMSGIFGTEEIEKFFDNPSAFVIECYDAMRHDILSCVCLAVVGNGTNSKYFLEQLGAYISVKIITVDERNTTLEARRLYWLLHRPNFWTKLLPEGLRVPRRVLDDLAAWSIARRGLMIYKSQI